VKRSKELNGSIDQQHGNVQEREFGKTKVKVKKLSFSFKLKLNETSINNTEKFKRVSLERPKSRDCQTLPPSA
jgi:hypothetical protein